MVTVKIKMKKKLYRKIKSVAKFFGCSEKEIISDAIKWYTDGINKVEAEDYEDSEDNDFSNDEGDEAV